MAVLNNVKKSPIKDKLGSLKYSSGYKYRDFWYTNASGKRIHVVGWHRAIDITTLGEVVAFESGRVSAITKGVKGQTTNPSSGNAVTLTHGGNMQTRYCHLDPDSNNHLKIGDVVKAGSKLGSTTKKTTGNSTGLHLHFAIYDGKAWVNPVDYLQGKKVITKMAEPLKRFAGVNPNDKVDQVIVTVKNLRIREKASTTSKILGYVTIDNYYDVLGKVGEWYQINHGFIHQSYCRLVSKKDNSKTKQEMTNKLKAFNAEMTKLISEII